MQKLLVALLLFFSLNCFGGTLYENVQMIEVLPQIFLETTIFKPPGPGPFPIVIMNHGKDLGPARGQARVTYKNFAQQFFDRGYAVILPMRRGFAQSTGPFMEDGCDLATTGRHQGDDISEILNYLKQLPWVDSNHIIIAGQSFGGLATMGFGSTNYPGVKLLINFAGVLKFERGCDWKAAMVDAFAKYGETAKIPSVWFYGVNDSYTSPEMAEQLYNVYTQHGAPAKLISFGPFKADAHGLIGWIDGVQIWWPWVEKELIAAGMPTEIKNK